MGRALWTLLCVSLVGCFDAPSPACNFLCGAAEECPGGYTCASDGFCKRNDVDEDFDCSGLRVDAAPPDAPPAVAICGNDAKHPDEACDDGNTATETECPYGSATCTLCNEDCTAELSLTGRICGDNTNDAEETCDDNNAAACGRCADDCQTTTGVVATGSVTVDTAGGGADSGTVVISDGTTAVTFEYDPNNDGVVAGTAFGSGTATVADAASALETAVNNSALLIDASAAAAVVSLTNQRVGTIGNVTITTTVNMTGAGMANGAGTPCDTGLGCGDDSDCTSGDCAAGTCAAL